MYATSISITGAIFTNQTGSFPLPYSVGNKCIFVLYDYGSSYIDARAMVAKTKDQIIIAYRASITMLQ